MHSNRTSTRQQQLISKSLRKPTMTSRQSYFSSTPTFNHSFPPHLSTHLQTTTKDMRLFALQTLRLASARTVPRSLPRALPRAFHSSPRVLAANPLDDPRMQELRDKISQHEGARDAIMKLGELMQGKGECGSSTGPGVASLLRRQV